MIVYSGRFNFDLLYKLGRGAKFHCDISKTGAQIRVYTDQQTDVERAKNFGYNFKLCGKVGKRSLFP